MAGSSGNATVGGAGGAEGGEKVGGEEGGGGKSEGDEGGGGREKRGVDAGEEDTPKRKRKRSDVRRQLGKQSSPVRKKPNENLL